MNENIVESVIRKRQFKEVYLRSAEQFASLSRCERKKVGAVAVKDNMIISIGFNGTPSGWDNECEHAISDDKIVTKPWVIHAEMNMVGKLAQSTFNAKGCEVYLTTEPCFECAKLLSTIDPIAVYYAEKYISQAHGSGAKFLMDHGIHVEHISIT